MDKKHLVVIGGGAAGFFCAVNAKHPQLKVTLLEKSKQLLSKVKISGGGRCNITHNSQDINWMSQQYPRGNVFLRKAFHQFFTHDTLNWFGNRGVKCKAEDDGRMFPSTNDSQTVIDCLLREAKTNNVSIQLQASVIKLLPPNNDLNTFEVHLSDGKIILADYVCVASGGYPKLSQFDWLMPTLHTIVQPIPSLFTFNLPKHPILKLMGLAAPNAHVKISGTNLQAQGPLLITHWGMSGPAILKLSAWGARKLQEQNWNFSIQVNWCGEEQGEEEVRAAVFNYKAEHPQQKIGNAKIVNLPQRLWHFLLEQSEVNSEQTLVQLTNKSLNKLINNLHHQAFEVKGKTTFKEEFVTAGGIDLKELDVKTMMSKKCKNLFFAGEALDIDGITGGFNFQNAWTTGYIAAKNIVDNLK